MSNAERFALAGICGRIRPELSLEIGTYQGGSLQVIAQYSKQVISLDLDPAVAARLDGKFPNVQFRSGNSATLLPELVSELNASGRNVGFVLIDGDHSREGVRRDVESVIKLKVKERMVILMHDGFNPGCRSGMREANWAACPHVHYVELDFTSGNFHAQDHDTAQARSMWGGFACAVLEPEERQGPLEIRERQRGLFEAIYPLSIHFPAPPPSFPRRVLRAGRRVLRKLVKM
jgi:Methyltransferase domain